MLTPSVEPSGVALATTSVPRLPLAPGLFSTRKVLLGYFLESPSATRRATISGVDPGPNGTMIRTVFVGQSCASADSAGRSRKSENTIRLSMEVSRADVMATFTEGVQLAMANAILYCGGILMRV